MKFLKVILVVLGILLILYNLFLYYFIYMLSKDANFEDPSNSHPRSWYFVHGHPISWYIFVNLSLVAGIILLITSIKWVKPKKKSNWDTTKKRVKQPFLLGLFKDRNGIKDHYFHSALWITISFWKSRWRPSPHIPHATENSPPAGLFFANKKPLLEKRGLNAWKVLLTPLHLPDAT
jgi:hypothetical protein